MPDRLLEWNAAGHAREGEDISGDDYLVCKGKTSGRVLVAVVDGIGHGPQAVAASRAAVATIEANADAPLESIFVACHEALHQTRGVAMSVASFQESGDRMSWLGVGNVEGRLMRADRQASPRQEELLLRSGVLGHNLPSTLVAVEVSVSAGDVLILATDGIRREFTGDLAIGKPAQKIAREILERHNRGVDDVLVVVAKYRGGRS